MVLGSQLVYDLSAQTVQSICGAGTNFYVLLSSVQELDVSLLALYMFMGFATKAEWQNAFPVLQYFD